MGDRPHSAILLSVLVMLGAADSSVLGLEGTARARSDLWGPDPDGEAGLLSSISLDEAPDILLDLVLISNVSSWDNEAVFKMGVANFLAGVVGKHASRTTTTWCM